MKFLGSIPVIFRGGFCVSFFVRRRVFFHRMSREFFRRTAGIERIAGEIVKAYLTGTAEITLGREIPPPVEEPEVE